MRRLASVSGVVVTVIAAAGCGAGSAQAPTTLAPIATLATGTAIAGIVRLGSTDAEIHDARAVAIYPPDADAAVKQLLGTGVHRLAYAGGLRRVAVLPFGDGPQPRLLVVISPDPAQPGVAPDDTLVEIMQVDPGTPFGDGGGGYVAIYTANGCRVDTSTDAAAGMIACVVRDTGAITSRESSVDLQASWRVAAVVDQVGPSLRVSWKLGGGYVSTGEALVWGDPTSSPAGSGDLRIPDVRVGGTFLEPELLRIVIRGCCGGPTFEGDEVEPTLQGVRSDSQRIVRESSPESAAPFAQPWTPLFGRCRATVASGGLSGSVSCPGGSSGVPEGVGRLRELTGSTSLEATWTASL